MQEKYPEHEKLRALEGANVLLSEFLDWLNVNGFVLAEWGEPYEVQAFMDVRELPPRLMEKYQRLFRKEPEKIDWAAAVRTAKRYDAVKWAIPEYSLKPGERETMSQYRFALPDPELGPPWNRCWFEDRANENVLWQTPKTYPQILSMFFGIDLQKLSEEKISMIEDIRAMSVKRREESA